MINPKTGMTPQQERVVDEIYRSAKALALDNAPFTVAALGLVLVNLALDVNVSLEGLQDSVAALYARQRTARIGLPN